MQPSPDAPRIVPRWVKRGLFLFQPPAMTARSWRVFGLVTTAAIFGQYDRSLLMMALPQIQAGLGIAEGDVGWLLGAVKAGALPAFALAAAADRFGRRRLLLFTIVGYALSTGATAIAPDTRSFVICQLLAHGLSQAELLISVVVLSEELSAEHRGWAIGAFLALQGTGVGLAALLLPFADAQPEGWRGLYLVGLGPLALLAWWRRTLPETQRFASTRSQPVAQRATFRALVQGYPGRILALGAAVFFFHLGGAAADFFGPKYLRAEHGYSAAQVSSLYLIGGALAITGGAWAGRWSDRLGRRPVTAAFVATAILSAAFFYSARTSFVAPAWILLIFVQLGADALLATYGTELFPTRLRATASGLRLLLITGGAVIGLALESWLYALTGSHWSAIRWLLVLALTTPLIVLWTLPETARRELESIAPSVAHPPERRLA